MADEKAGWQRTGPRARDLPSRAQVEAVIARALPGRICHGYTGGCRRCSTGSSPYAGPALCDVGNFLRYERRARPALATEACADIVELIAATVEDRVPDCDPA